MTAGAAKKFTVLVARMLSDLGKPDVFAFIVEELVL